MTTRALVSLTLSTLALGGVAAIGLSGGVASARDESATVRTARAQAGKAGEALAKGKPDVAVRLAEAVVAMQPRVADYRVLLGQSYLRAGRFSSARAAFADALTLAPSDGKAALDLALVETGLGDWAGARDVLTAHAETVPVADRGLGLALAGDPAGAVEVLTAAVRSPDATVKTRQNLALALALAGRWADARSVAAMDLPPADLDARLEQWAAFAHPTGAADQVAALLGVIPIADGGEPVTLALNAPAPVKVAQAAPTAAPVPAPLIPAATSVAPVIAAPAPTGVVFASASAVVQPLPTASVLSQPPAGTIESSASYKVAVKAALVRPAAHTKGEWFVQIGAYGNAAVARDDWMRATRRDAALRDFVPQGMTFQANRAHVYRVSVGGFPRVDADGLCHAFRVKGGHCFVRQGAGDQVASWGQEERAARLALSRDLAPALPHPQHAALHGQPVERRVAGQAG